MTTPQDSDIELLKLAAKAAGYQVVSDRRSAGFGGGKPTLYLGHNGPVWNPFDDDGDEARLEAALQMHVIWEPARNTVVVGRAEGAIQEPYGTNKQAARRRAGVRAAAEIGRSMT